MDKSVERCNLCPRRCNASRAEKTGYCSMSERITVARASLHMWEEPCISGVAGSGTVFFSGCSLGCVYCQNAEISRGKTGKEISEQRLVRICFELKERGAHNINLVTPSHYAPMIRRALLPVKSRLGIPIVCNTGGYDSPQVLSSFDGLVDVYLPDFKYSSKEVASRLSFAGDYPEIALEAIKMMYAQVGKPCFDENGMMTKGVMVRHLCLPGERKNSIGVMRILGENFKADEIRLSLMRQYTPMKEMEGALSRRVTTFEYESVKRAALEYGFEGYFQSDESVGEGFIPDFDLSGV